MNPKIFSQAKTKSNKLFSNNPLLIKFKNVICNQMSERTIKSLNHNELLNFISKLYDYFIVQHHQGTDVYLGRPSVESSLLTRDIILKISQPDVPHLFVTIEEILKQHNIRTARQLHPIIGIKRNKKGQIIDILQPSLDNERRSLVFIAFESFPSNEKLNAVKKDILFHINAVHQSQKDTPFIEKKINEVCDKLKKAPSENNNEWHNLLKWLTNQNFSFFGCHVLSTKTAKPTIKERYGICRTSVKIPSLIKPPKNIINHANHEDYMVDQLTITSPIQRFEPLMKISLKFKSTQFIFYGILKRSSMYAKNLNTPLIHKKMEYIFKQRQFLTGSYNYNEVIRIFNDIPKFELFRTTQKNLLEHVTFIMSITNPNHIVCLKKYNKKEKYLKLFFVIPYYFFNHQTINIIKTYICDQLDYSFREIIPINAPEKCRIHCYFKLNIHEKLPDEESIERTLTELIQPWEDQVLFHMRQFESHILDKAPTIINKIPTHYRSRTRPLSAVRDLKKLLELSDSAPVSFQFFSFDFPKSSDLAGKTSMLLIYHRTKINLTNILPILHNFGIHVIDQLTSRFGDNDSSIGFIHAFRLLDEHKNKLKESFIEDRLIGALHDIFSSALPNNPINKLILSSNLTSAQLFILQGLRNYAYQLFQNNYSLSVINNALTQHPKFSFELMTLFDIKFNPKISIKKRQKMIMDSTTIIANYIKTVSSIIDDQILNRLLSIMSSCARTNAYIKESDTPLSFKFDCSKIIGLATPIPFRETFVFDTTLEGIHIRFGEVARGGLRWSTRIEDYRTEVLGLVKTQQTKNAVIIPVGSKGGFIIKNQKMPISQDLGKTQYKRFISAMLQITDNIINHKRSINKSLICYDNFDPYFVVAADKGTATFSDIANQVSDKNQFWLSDGFASGGQHGYDHKKVGITAKGAWECCRLHFKSMNLNPETDPIRVVGVGDMSGDVFGNGMLLSKSIQLTAAFNHLHIFIDPNPDPLTSWKERQRLFKLPQSTWKDYKGISNGGGVFDRASKAIKCNKQLKKSLSIDADILSGEELIKAILCAPVDLLWFGGIGTYIKSSSESTIDVGDPANNRVRVNANDIQAKVISEGANLAITQLGRIEFEQYDGKINTDAIDNSAGVNMSDYEVNIKILLSSLKQKNFIKSYAERNKILDKATNEVTKLVLQNNIDQHNLISMDQFISIHQPFFIEQTIEQLINEGRLSPSDEYIPKSKERQEFYKQGIPMPRSVLAKCQAYTKMKIKEYLKSSKIFSGPIYDVLFFEYFPTIIQQLIHKSKTKDHRLKQQIIITQLTNMYVSSFGCSTFEKITCQNRLSLDKAIHQLTILKLTFKSIDKTYQSKAPISNFNHILSLNDRLTYCNFICDLLNIKLDFTKIEHYQHIISTLSPSIPIVLFPLFFLPTINQSQHLTRLSQLDDILFLFSNLKLLLSIPVNNGTTYGEKLSILSDLMQVVSTLIGCKQTLFDNIINKFESKFQNIPDTEKALSKLHLYVFELRSSLSKHFVTTP